MAKGLSCKDHSKHSTVLSDPGKAAEYYIQGLELLDAKDEDELGAGDMEILQDLTSGLCTLYRLGKIRPENSKQGQPPTNTLLDKGKEKEVSAIVKPARDGMISLWSRGGLVTTRLSRVVETLLGLQSHLIQDIGLNGYKDGSSKAISNDPAPQPGIHPDSEKPQNVSSIANGDEKIKKSVSFSLTPPKHRPLLDTISCRQARSALIHLYYICALVSFSSSSNDEKAKARKYWEEILTVGQENGSVEADDLVGKAKIRLEMLFDPLAAQRKEYKDPQVGKIALPSKAIDLTIMHMLSPPPIEIGGQTSIFHFESLSEEGEMVSNVNEAETGLTQSLSMEGVQNGSVDRHVIAFPDRDVHLSDCHSSRGPVKTAGHPSLQPALDLKQGSKSKTEPSGTPRRAQFSISDSPTSTVRSFTSLKAASSRSTGGNKASLPGYAEYSDIEKPMAPWPLLQSTSTTSLTLIAPKFDSSATSFPRPRIHLNGRHASSPPILQSFSLQGRNALKSPRTLIQPSLSRSGHWSTRASALFPSVHVSDPSCSTLNSIDLRKNSASVTSLPHYSYCGDAERSTRILSAAHFLFSHEKGSSRKSSSSLASLGSGMQKSFSSLRNYFSYSPIAVGTDPDLSDEEQLPESGRKMATEENEQLQKRLKETARRHDEAVAEMTYWSQIEGDMDKQSDSYNTNYSDDCAEQPEDASGQASENDDTRHSIAFTGPRKAIPYHFATKSSGLAGSSQIKPLVHSVPSSRLRYKADKPIPNPPLSPASHIRKKRRGGLPPLWTESNPSHSAQTSGAVTPDDKSRDVVGEVPGPFKIDPLLAALEDASRVNVKSRCAICAKQGVNFPKCQKCALTFCSRECRMSVGHKGQNKH